MVKQRGRDAGSSLGQLTIVTAQLTMNNSPARSKSGLASGGGEPELRAFGPGILRRRRIRRPPSADELAENSR